MARGNERYPTFAIFNYSIFYIQYSVYKQKKFLICKRELVKQAGCPSYHVNMCVCDAEELLLRFNKAKERAMKLSLLLLIKNLCNFSRDKTPASGM